MKLWEFKAWDPSKTINESFLGVYDEVYVKNGLLHYKRGDMTLRRETHFNDQINARAINEQDVMWMIKKLPQYKSTWERLEPNQRIWISSKKKNLKILLIKLMPTPKIPLKLSLATVVNDLTWQNPDPTVAIENFIDGRRPQDQGISHRLGIPKKASLSTLDKIGQGTGRKAQLARWQANMRRGRKKHENS